SIAPDPEVIHADTGQEGHGGIEDGGGWQMPRQASQHEDLAQDQRHTDPGQRRKDPDRKGRAEQADDGRARGHLAPPNMVLAVVRRRMIWNSRADFVADGLGSSVSGYAT